MQAGRGETTGATSNASVLLTAGSVGALIVVEDDEANADLVAVEDVLAFEADLGGAKVEMEFCEPALDGDEGEEQDEEPRSGSSVTAERGEQRRGQRRRHPGHASPARAGPQCVRLARAPHPSR